MSSYLLHTGKVINSTFPAHCASFVIITTDGIALFTENKIFFALKLK